MLRKLGNELLDWMLLRFNIFSEVVDPADFLSEDVIRIMESNGYFVRPAPNRRKIKCLLYNKRIIRPDLSRKKPKMFIPDWDHAGIKKKHELMQKAISISYFYMDPYAIPWNLAVYRDKESKKVSFFDFDGRTKTVFWSRKDHFEREANATSHFIDHGVDVLGHIREDRDKHMLVQELVGIPGEHIVDFNPVDDQMMDYVLRSAEMKTIMLQKPVNLPIEIQELADFAEQQIKRNFWVHNNKAPYGIVHGDLNPMNLIRDQGKTWLIDFDRTFEASVYYDFIYVWLNKYDRSTDKLKTRIRMINDRFYGENIMTDSVALNLALALFVYDNIRFIEQHCDTVKDARFVIFLLNRLRDKWPRTPVTQE